MELSRRHFLACAAAAAAPAAAAEPVIDIHQHTPYSGRTAEELVAHQRTMGITKTVLLPAGRKYGLAADAGGNDVVIVLAKQYPKEYVFFANELPDIPETKSVIEKYLKMGAVGIGEQKFGVESDSKYIDLVADIARHFNVPVLLHFQYKTYNLNFENFHKILERHPKVNFIGHAQTWWGNIDKNHDQAALYPKGKVTPGGLTDRWLSDYPNMYADMSAGSGLNAMMRDEEHAKGFMARHQNKLLYGSDCSDKFGKGEKCSGSQQLAAIRRLAPDAKAVHKILYANASRVIKIT
jgi:predicted TIM-barrel fold metal-dependent hydrolase